LTGRGPLTGLDVSEIAAGGRRGAVWAPGVQGPVSAMATATSHPSVPRGIPGRPVHFGLPVHRCHRCRTGTAGRAPAGWAECEEFAPGADPLGPTVPIVVRRAKDPRAPIVPDNMGRDRHNSGDGIEPVDRLTRQTTRRPIGDRGMRRHRHAVRWSLTTDPSRHPGGCRGIRDVDLRTARFALGSCGDGVESGGGSGRWVS
jgi:hypothetical protein